MRPASTGPGTAHTAGEFSHSALVARVQGDRHLRCVKEAGVGQVKGPMQGETDCWKSLVCGCYRHYGSSESPTSPAEATVPKHPTQGVMHIATIDEYGIGLSWQETCVQSKGGSYDTHSIGPWQLLKTGEWQYQQWWYRCDATTDAKTTTPATTTTTTTDNAAPTTCAPTTTPCCCSSSSSFSCYFMVRSILPVANSDRLHRLTTTWGGGDRQS